jgi:hypothetical protein
MRWYARCVLLPMIVLSSKPRKLLLCTHALYVAFGQRTDRGADA